MKTELRKKIIEENRYAELLKENPRFRLQGYSLTMKKHVVGIVREEVKEYKPYHHLDFKYFDSWKDAYMQLVK